MDDFIADAFIANQVRGMHGSGIFQVDKKEGANHGISMFKSVSNGSDFVGIKEARSIISNTNKASLTVGHVRHATAGKINVSNAHPFLVVREDGSQLVGVHNGTLRDWRHKDEGNDFDVDSNWAMSTIAREGLGAFRYFDGAYAFVWYDSRDPDVVYMARNEERPLHFMHASDNKTILGASELGMLGWIAERNKIKMASGKDTGMFYLTPNKMYKFSLKEVGSYTSVDVPKYDPSTGVYKAPPNFHMGHNNGHRGYYNYSRRYEENDDEYGMQDWFPAVPYGMDDKLEYIGKALQEARDARLGHTGGESKVGDVNNLDEDLEESIRTAITDFNETKKGNPLHEQLLHTPLFVHSPNESYAGSEAIFNARDMKIFGQVVLMEGILYDEDTATILGEYETIEDGGVILNITAEMKFAMARDAYTYVNNRTPVAIVGYNKGSTNGFASAMVAPLTRSQLALINHKLQAKLRRTAN